MHILDSEKSHLSGSNTRHVVNSNCNTLAYQNFFFEKTAVFIKFALKKNGRSYISAPSRRTQLFGFR